MFRTYGTELPYIFVIRVMQQLHGLFVRAECVYAVSDFSSEVLMIQFVSCSYVDVSYLPGYRESRSIWLSFPLQNRY